MNAAYQQHKQAFTVFVKSVYEKLSAVAVAEGYRGRWTSERAFGEITQSLNGEMATLAYPPAALLACASALKQHTRGVELRKYKKHTRGDKKPRPKRKATYQPRGYSIPAQLTSDSFKGVPSYAHAPGRKTEVGARPSGRMVRPSEARNSRR